MGSVFINQNETITVNVWVGEDENNRTRYWSKAEDQPEKALSAEKYDIVFRKPNFRDSTVLLDIGVRMNAEGGMDLAFSEIRYRRLEILLQSWNLKDGDGKSVPATPEQIANLHPTFAMVLAGALERELGIEDGSFDTDTEQTDQEETEAEEAPESPVS